MGIPGMSGKWHDFLDAQRLQRPGAPAFSDSLGNHWSFGDTAVAVADLAIELQEAGVQPGDRVLLLCENCAPVIAALFACSRIGAAVIPLNARQSMNEVTRVIAHAEPAVILFTSVVSAEARQHAGRFNTTKLSGSFGEMDMCTLQSGPDDLNDTAVILYTTGTTGAPKGVMLTHGNLLFAGIISMNTRGIDATDYVYGVLPLSHVFGLASVVTACACAGSHVFLEPRFSPSRLYNALCNGVTLLSAVPQMHAMLMQYTKEQGFDRLPVNTLRYISSGAAPLDPDWKRRAEAFYGVPVQNGFGMTEATAGICITRSELGDPDISCGLPFPGVEVKLDFDAIGAENEVGEVLVRGDNVMSGYFRDPEATARTFTDDGWLRTGDLGSLDEHGRLHIRGRSKELIIHGGFNVYPPEVEAVLSEHPQVIQAAVIGQKTDGDELVVAFVQAAIHDLPDPEALREFVAQRLTGYKRPSRIEVLTDLPAAATGKILKHKLHELL
ncbi:MAG: class I adenylate-forming enzyme family protein [Granulosicoccus sp.]